MKTRYLLAGILYIIGIVYLVLPSPVYPDLSQAVLSDEPGDTWQNPNQKGFYTNSDRQEVLSDIQSKFRLSLGHVEIPSYRLNYRPEEAYDFVRDQLQSYYLEEIVYPLRESIFVNGWEPKKSPIYAGSLPKEIPDISIHGVAYNAKITLKPTGSPVWARILIWTLLFPSVYFITLSYRKIFSENDQN